MHVNAGQKLRADGKLEEAMGEFQRALIADPSSAIAMQEIKRTQQMMRREEAREAGRSRTDAGGTRAARSRQAHRFDPGAAGAEADARTDWPRSR